MSNISVSGKAYDVDEATNDAIKKLVEEGTSIEVVDSLNDLIGSKFAFQCARYIYFGKVKKVNEVFIELSDAQTVFDTGAYSSTSASDAQEMPKGKTFVMRQSIEAIYPTKW